MTFGGFGNARKYFQQRALARAVAADDPDDLAAFDFERDVFERPDRFRFLIAHCRLQMTITVSGQKMAGRPKWRCGCRAELFLESLIGLLIRTYAIALAQTFDFHCNIGHKKEARDQRSEIRSQRSENGNEIDGAVKNLPRSQVRDQKSGVSKASGSGAEADS